MAMNKAEREQAIIDMQNAASAFYIAAINIGNHPFIEFTGLMNEYIKLCGEAHNNGLDFTECNTHSGKHLPMHDYEVRYINEKLECIFTGRSVVSQDPTL